MRLADETRRPSETKISVYKDYFHGRGTQWVVYCPTCARVKRWHSEVVWSTSWTQTEAFMKASIHSFRCPSKE